MAPPIRDFLFHPDRFFQALADGPNEYKIPVIIVGTCMVLDAIRQFLLMDWMMQYLLPVFSKMTDMPAMNQVMTGAVNVLLFASVAENIPAFIAYWLIIAAVVFILSSYFSSEGTIYKTIIATGWGMAPLIIYNAIALPLFFAYRNTMAMTISPEIFNRTQHHSYRGSSMRSGEFMDYVTFNQPFIEHSQIDFAIFALTLLWSSVYWTYAMKNIRKISTGQAALSCMLPVIIILAALLALKMTNSWIS